MGNSNELNQPSEVNDAQLDALASQQMAASQVIAINNLKNQVKDQIKDAGEYFSKADKDRWLEKLESTSGTNTSEIQAISQQIEKEKVVVSKMLTQYIGTINSNREFFGVDPTRKLDTAQQYIDDFKNLPLEEKMEWLNRLSGEIDGLKSLYETAKSLAPDQMAKFNTLRRSEKKEFLNTMKGSRSGLKQLEELLNKHKSHISPTEMEKIRQRMKDVPPSEQEDVLKQILEKEITPRTEITQKFRTFPAEMRDKFPNFNEMNRTEREAAVDTLMQDLGKNYRTKLFESPLSKHISDDSKEKAYTWFVQAPPDQRVQALQMLESQMRLEEKLALEYEDLLEQMPTTTDDNQADVAQRRREFYNSQYEVKANKLKELKAKLEEMEAEGEEVEGLKDQYEDLLDNAVENKYISESTRERDLERFDEEDLATKKNDIEHFGERMKPRIELTNRFHNELSEEIQDEHSEEFYSLGYRDRLEKFEALLKLQKNPLKKVGVEGAANDNADKPAEIAGVEKNKNIEDIVKDLIIEASMAEGEEDYEEALACYEKILVLQPENKFALKRAEHLEELLDNEEALDELTNAELERKIREAKAAEDILEARKIYTINSVLGETIEASDRKQNKIRADEKDSHLKGQYKDIQEDLIEGHDMMLNNEGKAVDIEEVDLGGMEEMSEGEIHELGSKVAHLQGNLEHRNKVHNFQAVDASEHMSGQQWLKHAKEQKEELDEAVLDKVNEKLENEGVEIDEDTAENLEKKVQKSKQDVKLAA